MNAMLVLFLFWTKLWVQSWVFHFYFRQTHIRSMKSQCQTLNQTALAAKYLLRMVKLAADIIFLSWNKTKEILTFRKISKSWFVCRFFLSGWLEKELNYDWNVFNKSKNNKQKQSLTLFWSSELSGRCCPWCWNAVLLKISSWFDQTCNDCGCSEE